MSMRVLRALGLGAAALTLSVTSGPAALAATPAEAPAPAQARAAASESYYLSLGDSLSTGYQPGLGDTDEGYADRLHQVLKAFRPGLKLVKLGCTGETANTFVNGGKCAYGDADSQLDAAVDFLRAHPGKVSYVTLNIGANDINACVRPNGVDTTCLTSAMQGVAANLTRITQTLKEAGAAGTVTPRYVGMGTFDPLLAAWLRGPAGQEQARQSVQLVAGFNALESGVYRKAGFGVVDADRLWHTADFTHTVTLRDFGTVPVNVGLVCSLTTMCTKGDLHPTPAGYAYIAAAFAVEIATGRESAEG
ncbi:SGNH/GDSL hydrolase family protein [Streptomyces sp. NPDC090025]|uniref:SGNH/GDSL hydrolase family protein n=1 Tax=Streptomyces sp. NPDC090025 TaxID=3365922 RepID=UPI003832BB8D